MLSKNLHKTVCAAALIVGTSFGPAISETADAQKTGFIEEVGGSERVDSSGKLRMLSQRIPNTACYAHAGIKPEASEELLMKSRALFQKIITGLEKGDTELGMIGAEKDRKVIAKIQDVHKTWGRVFDATSKPVAEQEASEIIPFLKDESAPLLAAAKLLVSEVVREYSDPTALLGKDALAIDIAGRQRMLSQRISKNACLIATGYGSEKAQKELEGARKMFNVSAQALRFGLPAAGIQPIDNDDINNRLDEVLQVWAGVQPLLDRVSAGDDLSEADVTAMFTTFNSLTGKMNTIVGLYSDASKLNL
ncbi:MAG: type IV pili methyl-accepting chemotaxis transducer N-terminal domain-containing protein [Pseudomonadota bacterium]